ncbi:telomere-associated recq helicase [Fusarium austroafricanum]|uniref:DNA 3'-5' helicase n=1 Tax=Fusarium austroafricanum TaxID=2364996 RepID=A0A8H4KH79_9HYPO|nr:telomere-associated recq helicase [Fusarium austroafricanum]
MVLSCLQRACTRAEVPQFQVAWWRQVAASITKEKFSAREQANFDIAYFTVPTERLKAGGLCFGLIKCSRKVRFRARPAAKEDGITAAACRLHNDPELQLRRPGQRDAMLATIGPRAPEQATAVLATGSGKTLVSMAGATLAGAEITIPTLPTIAPRSNMLGRLDKVAPKHHIRRPGPKKPAPIVAIPAEAACIEASLEYANRLSDRQYLDRIAIDECHPTITASCYRRSMSQLAWHVRQTRTQTVWPTAILPPIYQEPFSEHNKLARPHTAREPTNRPNIQYIIQQECGLGNLYLFKSEQDRVIIYCPTKDLVAELADMLGCPSYTAKSGTEEEKMAIIERWLTAANSPIIVATSALGPGFNYPHIQLCMEGDELCSVCPEHYAQCRPPTLEFHLPRPLCNETEARQDGDNGSADLAVSEIIFTGPAEVLRQDQAAISIAT